MKSTQLEDRANLLKNSKICGKIVARDIFGFPSTAYRALWTWVKQKPGLQADKYAQLSYPRSVNAIKARYHDMCRQIIKFPTRND